MTERQQVYQCGVCGNMVTVVHAAAGTLTCCKQAMNLLQENSVEAAVEKHVPVLEGSGEGVMAKIGSVAHPMDDDHFIEWVEIEEGGKAFRHYLKPGQSPEALFPGCSADVKVRAYCNLHGLWKG